MIWWDIQIFIDNNGEWWYELKNCITGEIVEHNEFQGANERQEQRYTIYLVQAFGL